MLTIPIEKAKQTLIELADQVTASGEPVVLEFPDGRKVLLADYHLLHWLESFKQYKPPSRQEVLESLKRAAALRDAMRAGAATDQETAVETLNRIREERLRELSGMH